MPLEIEVADPRWKRVPKLGEQIIAAYQASLTKKGLAKITVLLLADDATLKALNRGWRGINKPTNVLSFPAAEAHVPRGTPRPMGDVALSYDTCAKEAKAAAKSLRDHAVHLVVHGLLHLCGHDHVDEAEAHAMEAKEIRILAKLGIANPYVLNAGHD